MLTNRVQASKMMRKAKATAEVKKMLKERQGTLMGMALATWTIEPDSDMLELSVQVSVPADGQHLRESLMTEATKEIEGIYEVSRLVITYCCPEGIFTHTFSEIL